MLGLKQVVWRGLIYGPGLGVLLAAQSALGQSITLDGTLGPIRSLGTGPIYTIRQTDGTTVGTNLFHSFGRFDLATGEIANFQSATAIQNILARVTGGPFSSIDGLITTTSPAVNLFLINPAGIVFGPNARLDIGGTTRGDFTATTLDAIVWSDGSRFDAANPSGPQPLLRIVGDPSGFLASQRQIPEITVDQSILQVYETQDLRLLGGDVSVVGGPLGRLDAWGGRIEIGAVAGPGKVELLGNGGFRFPIDLVRGNVKFSDAAFVNVMLDDGGDIGVTGRDIEVLSGSILRAGIDRNLGSPTSQAGLLELDATGTVIVVGDFSQVANDVRTGATGKGGDLQILAQDVVVRDGGRFTTITFGTGSAGNVVITASDSVLFQNGDAFSSVSAGAKGQGGNVEISTGNLVVRDGAQLIANTRGEGDAGNVVIDARDSVLFQGTSTDGRFISAAFSNVEVGAKGRGGNVEISTDSLKVRDGAKLISATRGEGDAGNVRIIARNSVLFKGTRADGQDFSAAASTVEAGAKGKGGDVEISTGSLEVLDGARLTASTLSEGNAGNIKIAASDSVLFQGTSADGQLSSAAFSGVDVGAKGEGGNVEISTGHLVVRDGAALVTATQGVGNAGNVAIAARGSILFQGSNTGATSSVSAGAMGRGGNVEISTGNLVVRDGAQLSASTRGEGDAGNVLITAHESVLFQGSSTDGQFGSAAFSSVSFGAKGQGGNVEISTGSLVVSGGAALTAATNGEGDAGNVLISARDSVTLQGFEVQTGQPTAILANNGGTLTNTGTGASGNIVINAGTLNVLDGALLDTRTLNNQRGGDISLTLGQLNVLNGGQINAVADSSGVAGTITINARDRVQISGSDPTWASRVALLAVIGDFTQPESTISVRSRNTGTAGDLLLNASRLLLSDAGQLIADSDAKTGGDITLNLDQALIMRNGSLISATAGRAQGAGDGGNITINAPFIISLPGENNDIIANAFSGTGGNITIDAEAILNFTANDKGKTFEQLRGQSTNDISASSAFGSNGILNLSGLNINPAQGIAQLPNETRDPQPIQGCEMVNGNNPTTRAEFFTSGRGGRPLAPKDSFSNSEILDDLRLPSTLATQPTSSVQQPILGSPDPSQIVEANAWYLSDKGEVVLTVNPSTSNTISDCHLQVVGDPVGLR